MAVLAAYRRPGRPGRHRARRSTISIKDRKTWVVRLANRPDPFDPQRELRTWVGNGHIVAWGMLAWVFVLQSEAEAVAARFGTEASVVKATGLMTGTRLRELMGHVVAARPEWAEAIQSSSMDAFHDMQREWLRALRVKDERCDVSSTNGEAAWRLRREAPEWFILSLDE